jgi:hypothetical protein
VSDATPVILVSIILFMLPSRPLVWNADKKSVEEGQDRPQGPQNTLLDWKSVHEKSSWSIMILLGGGFAIAEAAQVSCLSAWIGDKVHDINRFEKQYVYIVEPCFISDFRTGHISTFVVLCLLPYNVRSDTASLQLGCNCNDAASLQGNGTDSRGTMKLNYV